MIVASSLSFPFLVWAYTHRQIRLCPNSPVKATSFDTSDITFYTATSSVSTLWFGSPKASRLNSSISNQVSGSILTPFQLREAVISVA